MSGHRCRRYTRAPTATTVLRDQPRSAPGGPTLTLGRRRAHHHRYACSQVASCAFVTRHRSCTYRPAPGVSSILSTLSPAALLKKRMVRHRTNGVGAMLLLCRAVPCTAVWGLLFFPFFWARHPLFVFFVERRVLRGSRLASPSATCGSLCWGWGDGRAAALLSNGSQLPPDSTSRERFRQRTAFDATRRPSQVSP